MAKIQTGKHNSKKDVIIQKAAALFKEKSYSAASMRELADAVGVEAPSLYNHIGSKSELLQDICFTTADQFTSQVDMIESGTLPVARKIEQIIRFHIRMMIDHYDTVFVANHEWKHLKEPFLTDFLTQRRSYEKRLMSLVEKGIEQNELKKTNPYIAVLTILSAVRGLEYWHRQKKNVSPQVLEDDMVNHLLNGIKR